MITVTGYFGLGDNIYQYPFVKSLASKHDRVYLYSPFPELYHAVPNVLFCNRPTDLKTQKKNMLKHDRHRWVLPQQPPSIKFDYHAGRRNGVSVIKSFERCTGVALHDFYLDFNHAWLKEAQQFMPVTHKKICIIKFPTLRDEWMNVSRNPPMKYFKTIVEELKDQYYFIGLSDNTDGEYFTEEPPKIDMELYHGEASWEATLGLTMLSDLVVCYPSYFLPASLALKKRCFCVYGGSAGNKYLTDPVMETRMYSFIEPSPMCNCFRTDHDCNKILNEQLMLQKLKHLIGAENYAATTVGM